MRWGTIKKAVVRNIGNVERLGDTSGELPSEPEPLILNEAQLILSEKRTSLAAMRTGIAVFALPLSVLGLLIATSRYYDVLHVLPMIFPLGAMLLALIALGSYLIIRSLRNIHRYDRWIQRLKARHSKLSEFID